MIHNRWICRLKIKNEKPCSPVYFDKAMDLVGRWHKMRDELLSAQPIAFFVLITE